MNEPSQPFLSVDSQSIVVDHRAAPYQLQTVLPTMVEITPCVHIHAPWLDGGGVAVLDVTEVDGLRFFKVKKTDSRIQRLLSGQGNRCNRLLTSTSIVETLIKLRNTRRIALLTEYGLDLEADGAKEELELDGGCAKPKDMSHLLPDAVDIICPAHGDIAAVTLKVLVRSPSSPLWLELSASSIEYLHRVVVDQTKVDKHPAKKARCDDAKLSPYWDKNRGAFRVRYHDGPGGQIKFKDFRPSSSADEDRSTALHNAQEFASTCSS